MKILMIFIDMLRSNLLNLYDEKNPVCKVDEMLTKLGGTVYTCAYTPAPDTPRSNGCLWTSKYPKENGCDNRLKYPRYYLNPELQDLLSLLKNDGYSMNFYIAPAMRRTGELPPSVNEYGTFSEGKLLKDFLTELQFNDKTFTFLGFNDFHQVITDSYAQRKYVSNGLTVAGNAIKEIDDQISIDSFDLTIIYSDHGFKMREEDFNTVFKKIGDSRTKITLFVHKKGDHGIIKNDDLHSIMDIYPTICDYCGISYGNIDGISLFSPKGLDRIIIEDHSVGSVNLGQVIECYGIRTKQGLASVDCGGNWEADYNLTEEQKDEFDQLLSDYATAYSDNTKMTRILSYYKQFLVACPTYYDGTKRTIHKPIDETVREVIGKMSCGLISMAKRMYYWIKKR